ncbi:hypothetical protein [Shewanella sp.]
MLEPQNPSHIAIITTGLSMEAQVDLGHTPSAVTADINRSDD